MSQAVALFGLKLKPGEVHRVSMVFNEFKITNVSFGENLTGNKRAVIKVHHIPHYGHPSVADEEDSDDDDEEDDEEDEEAAEAKELARAEKAYTERTFVLCTLTPGKIEQATVDIAFSEDEDIGFSVTGDNEVDLLGNYTVPAGVDEPPYSDDESDSEIDPDDSDLYDSDGYPIGYDVDSEDEDDEEIDSDEYGSDDIDGLEAILAEEDSGLEDEDDEDDDDEEESDESRIEELGDEPISSKASAKKRKAEEEAEADVSMATSVTDAELAKAAAAEGLDMAGLSKSQRKRLNKKLKAAGGEEDDVDVSIAASTSSAKPTKEQKKEQVKATVVENGKAKTAAKETTAQNGKTTSSKTKLPNGVVVEVKKSGSGPAAKKGQKIGMRYIGKLAKNGKVFDQNTKGKPFTFKLGRGEVIKAWDEGIVGMQAGEERRLTCPPATAYGSRGAPPDIPGNSTLVFDVKCITIG